jgi:hypothetical protein
MGDVSDRFRARAIECRLLAEKTCEGVARNSLLEIADDLDAEADKIDAEDAASELQQT